MAIEQALVTATQTPWRVEVDDGTHRWAADEPVALGGGDTAPSPFELLCSALGACTAITVRMYAVRKQWPLQGVRVKVTLNPGGRPEGGGNTLERQIVLEGPLDADQRERLLQIANACPTHKLLSGAVAIPTQLVESV